uniref:Ig-like domain-containing protein n=1 Tax=Chelonoidis abingdonii TaxID=106734 RepID=A0A8C0GM60_CHEAB
TRRSRLWGEPRVGVVRSAGEGKREPRTGVAGGQLTLNCSQNSTRYTNMYWYKQAVGKDARLQLVVFSMESSGAQLEKPFEGHFQSNGTKNYVLSLSAESAQVQDSGTYYCAKQDHTVTQLWWWKLQNDGGQPAAVLEFWLLAPCQLGPPQPHSPCFQLEFQRRPPRLLALLSPTSCQLHSPQLPIWGSSRGSPASWLSAYNSETCVQLKVSI